ncbi:conserved phage C-terminal domain-containing protein [Lacticaseibacillus pantheris]|uniref:conserved phage C-terminal domain-containing protein n=1 Tax=Lacticaseibacillus pantheris TaxID=171523 RepID=UPI001CDAFD06
MVKEVLAYLNQKTGKRFRNVDSNSRLIKARINEASYSLDDFKTVIDSKTQEWLQQPEMVKYLQPSTLFAKKHFDEYLNAAPSTSRATPPITSNTTSWFRLVADNCPNGESLRREWKRLTPRDVTREQLEQYIAQHYS